MSRDELLNDIFERLDIIRTTDSMKELDIAHIGLRENVERFALAHRRRWNCEYPDSKKTD